MADKPEWLQRMHDAQVGERRPVEDTLPAFLQALSQRPDDYSVLTVATRESGHRDVSLVLGDLRAAHDELVELRAMRERLQAMASPDWAGSLRFPLVHGVDIVRLARVALTGEDPS